MENLCPRAGRRRASQRPPARRSERGFRVQGGGQNATRVPKLEAQNFMIFENTL